MNATQAAEILDRLLTYWQMAVNAGPLTDPGTTDELISWGLSVDEALTYIAEFDAVDQVAQYERKQAQLDAVNWLINRAYAFESFLADLKKSGGQPLLKLSPEHQFD